MGNSVDIKVQYNPDKFLLDEDSTNDEDDDEEDDEADDDSSDEDEDDEEDLPRKSSPRSGSPTPRNSPKAVCRGSGTRKSRGEKQLFGAMWLKMLLNHELVS